MKRSFFALAVSLLAAASLLVGCSSGAKQITLTQWDLHTDPNRQKAIDTIMTKWNATHKNITIQFDHITNEGTQFKTKIQTALAADEQPDMFFMFSGFFVKPFIESGKILALDTYIAKDKTYDRTISGKGNFSHGVFNGKTYGLPESWNIAPIYCNTKLFADNGVKLPETFDDLMAAVKAFKAKGIIPITLGAGGIWPGILIYEQLCIQHGGQALLRDVANNTCKDPGFLAAAKDFKALVDAGAFPPNAPGLAYQEAEDLFTRGKTAMYIMGNWCAAPLQQNNTFGIENIKPIPFVSVKDGKGTPNDMWGGSTVLYCISAKTKNPDAAFAWDVFFAENYSIEAQRLGESISVWKNDLKIDNPLQAALMPIVAKATTMTWGWDFAFPAKEASDYMDKLNLVLSGKMTPEEFAAALPGAK
jgi:raffinose/stachyose/melibiose transport system substrate-binding protein